ncbi:hypothetical protein C3L33_17862, partial [Rhododendron williamsianum]
MAMSTTSPNSLLLKNPNRHLINNPTKTSFPMKTQINSFPINNSSGPKKPISITCAASPQVQDRASAAAAGSERVFNFAAGPAILPENVLRRAESELYNWRGSGMRKELIGNAQEITPVMLDYKIHADNNSLYNTPPCFGIYMCGLVFEDLLAQGGLVEVEKNNIKKGQMLYNAIDESKGFYRCPVEKSVRSLMNVPFTLEKSELEEEFVKEAAKEKMLQLKGHRSVGGFELRFTMLCLWLGLRS